MTATGGRPIAASHPIGREGGEDKGGKKRVVGQDLQESAHCCRHSPRPCLPARRCLRPLSSPRSLLLGSWSSDSRRHPGALLHLSIRLPAFSLLPAPPLPSLPCRRRPSPPAQGGCIKGGPPSARFRRAPGRGGRRVSALGGSRCSECDHHGMTVLSAVLVWPPWCDSWPRSLPRSTRGAATARSHAEGGRSTSRSVKPTWKKLQESE
jgi:hypothetical protein